jgi:hypothetical protein
MLGSLRLAVTSTNTRIERLGGFPVGFGRYIGVNPAAMPGSVHDLNFLGPLHGRTGTNKQMSVWRDAAAALKTDPQAKVEIADPPPPSSLPSPVVQVQRGRGLSLCQLTFAVHKGELTMRWTPVACVSSHALGGWFEQSGRREHDALVAALAVLVETEHHHQTGLKLRNVRTWLAVDYRKSAFPVTKAPKRDPMGVLHQWAETEPTTHC